MEGNIVDNIVTVDITLDSTKTTNYKAKVIVYFTQEWFFKLMDELGGQGYLEENKIFAICFDKTPLNRLHECENYYDVVDKYPNCDKIPDQGFYIGNLGDDYLKAMTSILEYIFKDGYEIVYMEGAKDDKENNDN